MDTERWGWRRAAPTHPCTGQATLPRPCCRADREGMTRERVCDGCDRLFTSTEAIDELVEIDTDFRLCEDCQDSSATVLDTLVPERRPETNDSATPPLGDPGEAGRSDAV